MKVFVCYRRSLYEGYFELLTVFYEQSSAIEWCKSRESRKSRPYDYYEYQEMEVQE